jgi:hypothetical protein
MASSQVVFCAKPDTRSSETNSGHSPPRTPAGLPDSRTQVDKRDSSRGVASHRPPQGLPCAAPGASPASSTGGGEVCCPQGSAWSGSLPTGRHTTPRVQDHSRSKPSRGNRAKTYLLDWPRAPRVPVLRATRGQQRSLQSSVAEFPQVSILLVRVMIHPRSSKLGLICDHPQQVA